MKSIWKMFIWGDKELRSVFKEIKMALLWVYYHTLTAENVDKIIKQKEEEWEDLDTLEKQELAKIDEADLFEEFLEELDLDNEEQEGNEDART